MIWLDNRRCDLQTFAAVVKGNNSIGKRFLDGLAL